MIMTVTETAKALVDLNTGDGKIAIIVEIGHYAFAATWGAPGTFTPTNDL